MSVECQVNVKYQSELDIGGRETCYFVLFKGFNVCGHFLYLLFFISSLIFIIILMYYLVSSKIKKSFIVTED